MHMARSPTSLPSSASVGAGDSLELSLTGSQLSVSRRPSSASPAKHFSRSVSVTADNKSKRNTLQALGCSPFVQYWRGRYEKQLQEEEQALQQQRRRLYSEVAEEKERESQLAARQRMELDELRKHLEDNSLVAGRALREEFERTREEQERRHQEAWLLSRERELKEELRRGRDKEIELVIQRLEEETSRARDECERASENRVKRVREKYETELREMERSERSLQERHSELKGRLSQAEGEAVRLQGLLRQKEQEVQDMTQIQDRLTEERRSLAEVIRQEFADRLVTTEEENRRMKTEMSETRARQRLELERVTREKEEELAEVHKRVKTAIVKKEETVNNLRKQHEAALKRADHLEALLEQQRKQLLGKYQAFKDTPVVALTNSLRAETDHTVRWAHLGKLECEEGIPARHIQIFCRYQVEAIVPHTYDVKRWLPYPVVAFTEPLRAEPEREVESCWSRADLLDINGRI
ncbi:UNVERIFIED_CONTAM: hypothetical protein FKN15_059895 [Acipenser sinensis]